MCDGLTQLRVTSTPRVKVEVVKRVGPSNELTAGEIHLLIYLLDRRMSPTNFFERDLRKKLFRMANEAEGRR